MPSKSPIEFSFLGGDFALSKSSLSSSVTATTIKFELTSCDTIFVQINGAAVVAFDIDDNNMGVGKMDIPNGVSLATSYTMNR